MLLIRLLANRDPVLVKGKFFSRFTEPPYDSCRVPHDRGKIRYILCNHRSGADEGEPSDRVAAYDRRICTE